MKKSLNLKSFLNNFSEANLKKYDNIINITLIVLSLILLVPIIKFLAEKSKLNATKTKKFNYNNESFSNKNKNSNSNKVVRNPEPSPSKKEFVFYHATWCPHCTDTMPEWEKLKAQYKNKSDIQLKAIDEASLSTQEKTNLDIKGYPTIVLILDGKKIEYSGARTVEGFDSFLSKY
jgi:thiol-disulfide isomerase/thioredoxin